jgi:hypothetical protein
MKTYENLYYISAGKVPAEYGFASDLTLEVGGD